MDMYNHHLCNEQCLYGDTAHCRDALDGDDVIEACCLVTIAATCYSISLVCVVGRVSSNIK